MQDRDNIKYCVDCKWCCNLDSQERCIDCLDRPPKWGDSDYRPHYERKEEDAKATE